jgi:hypothetical protein
MCSRYSLTSPHEAVRAYFRFSQEHVFPPRYNIAPSQPVAIVRRSPAGERELSLGRWGLLPPWVKDPRKFATLINARLRQRPRSHPSGRIPPSDAWFPPTRSAVDRPAGCKAAAPDPAGSGSLMVRPHEWQVGRQQDRHHGHLDGRGQCDGRIIALVPGPGEGA